MNKTVKILKNYSVLFAALTVLGIVLRSISLFSFYDSDIGYYKTEAVLPDIFHLLSVAVLPAALSAVFLLPKKDVYSYPKLEGNKALVSSGAIFCMASVAAYIVYSLVSLTTPSYAIIGSAAQNKMGEIVPVLALVFGVISIIYLCLVLLGKTRDDKHVYFGYTVILFVLMVLAKSYFDFYTTMNSPNKLLTQITLMAVMVYMLYELRLSLDNAAPRGYVCMALASLYFTAVCSVPGIIAFFAGRLDKTEYLLCDFLALGFAVYIGTRLAAYIAIQDE